MTKYPGAAWRPLSNTQTEPKMARVDIICLHTMVGSLLGTDDMFHRDGYGGTESHFGVGGVWGRDAGKGLDGTVYQWQDLDYQADANLDGNPAVVSIETADNAPESAADIRPWTPAQVEAIAQLVAWLCRRYDVPAVLIPDTKPGRRGIGYHRQGCEHSRGLGVSGFLVVGGVRWSRSIGKECPGQARINQIPAIITQVTAILNGEDDDMQLTDKFDLTDADLRASGRTADEREVSVEFALRQAVTVWPRVSDVLDRLGRQVTSLESQVASLSAKLGGTK